MPTTPPLQNTNLVLVSQTLEIRNVWAENLDEEMVVIRELVEKYPYVAMDTEFPGVVAKPVSETYTSDYHYRSLKVNVDLLRIIQLGLAFADEDGNFAPNCPCWQFNFKFSLDDDMFAQDSIDLLITSGISFADHARRGIDPQDFGELMMVSGLVLDDRVKWVSFHSGYDYGYLFKLLTTQDLPADEKTFMELLKIYFPTIYDIKYMTSLLDGHFGGLQKLADALGCPRIGQEHQAGSDSLLTMSTYFALAKAKFTGSDSKVDDTKYKNELYGYGVSYIGSNCAAIIYVQWPFFVGGGNVFSILADQSSSLFLLFELRYICAKSNHTVRKGPIHHSNSSVALSNGGD